MDLKLFYLSLGFLLSLAGCVVAPLIRRTPSLGLIGLILSLSVYGYLGDYLQLRAYYSPEQREARKKLPLLRQFIAELKKQEFTLRLKLEEKPDEPATYWALGEIYELKQDLNKAALAYKKAYHLDKTNLNILAHYLSLRSRIGQGRLDAEDRQALEWLLVAQPQHAQGLNLRALDAYGAENYRAAIVYWSKLQAVLPADAKVHSELTRLISRAEDKVADLKKRL